MIPTLFNLKLVFPTISGSLRRIIKPGRKFPMSVQHVSGGSGRHRNQRHIALTSENGMERSLKGLSPQTPPNGSI
jgi:hypothetical protein